MESMTTTRCSAISTTHQLHYCGDEVRRGRLVRLFFCAWCGHKEARR